MRPNRKQLIWISLGALALLLRYTLFGRPDWTEFLYSRGLYHVVRWGIDYGLAWLPIPLVGLFLLGIAFWGGRYAIRFFRKAKPWRTKAFQFGYDLLAFAGGVTFFFLLLWGYNYGRMPIEKVLGLSPRPLTKQDLWNELYKETETLMEMREAIGLPDSLDIKLADLPDGMESRLRSGLVKWLRENGFPSPGRVRGKLVYPKGIFLRFSSSGLYFPLTGEGHVDAGLHPLQIPYVMAHEMGHGYGFGDEGTCNFLGYMACMRSGDPFLMYSGQLNYWRTLASNVLQYDREAYREFRDKLPVGIQTDLNSINATLMAYPDILPDLRYMAYNTYLKAQGIHEGMDNYNRVLMLVKAWKEARRS